MGSPRSQNGQHVNPEPLCSDKPAVPMDSNRYIDGMIKQLSKTCASIDDHKLRIWLLRKLMSKGLATRDIISFIEGQAGLRSDIKDMDTKTMNSAMRTKLKDVKTALARKIRSKKDLEEKIMEKEKERNIKTIRKNIKNGNRGARENKKVKYMRKIDHYEMKRRKKVPEEPFHARGRKNKQKTYSPTAPPKNLEEFSSLAVFGTAGDLPEPEQPVGPCICSKSIILTKEERKILSKDPKYSILRKINKIDFHLELEKMNSKHRYWKRREKRKKSRGTNIVHLSPDENQNNEALSGSPSIPGQSEEDNVAPVCEGRKTNINKASSGSLSIPGQNENTGIRRGKLQDETERRREINKHWQENRNSYIYNPILNEINFNARKATDYKINKTVQLPKPLEAEEEFKCEQRRRAFIGTFDKVSDPLSTDNKKKERSQHVQTHNIKSKKKKKNTRKNDYFNLSWEEILGLKSLKRRIKEDELVVAQTDKSSRFAVLEIEQYLRAGRCHTKKDKEIDWNTVNYLQNQVNDHVWWLCNILGYSKDSDKMRMLRNVQDHGREVPEMILLVKDHKTWSENDDVPTRPVVSGNKGINTHLSELLSEILEPISNNMVCAEVVSTEEALNRINVINDTILRHEEITSIDALEIYDKNDNSNGQSHHTLYNSAPDSYAIKLTGKDSNSSNKENIFKFSLDQFSDDNDSEFEEEIFDANDVENKEYDFDQEDKELVDLLSQLKSENKQNVVLMEHEGQVVTSVKEKLTEALSGSPSIPGQKGHTSASSDGYSTEALCGSLSIPGQNGKNVSSSKGYLTDGLCGSLSIPGQIEVKTMENEASTKSSPTATSVKTTEASKNAKNEFNNQVSNIRGERKITDFFRVIDHKNFSFGRNIQEKKFREKARKTKLMKEKVRADCLAGRLWLESREEERVRMMKERLAEKLIKERESIQDTDEAPILFGADVCALYPSLDQTETAALVAQAVKDSEISITGVDYEMLSVYLFLTLGEGGMRKCGLDKCIPKRIYESKSESLSSKINRNCASWEYFVDIDKEMKDKLVATMVHVAMVVVMKTSCYLFGGKIYLQTSGSGIGQRVSACAAKIIMAIWDKELALSQRSWGIHINLFMRYIDDLRLYMFPIKKGWYWCDGRWEFRKDASDDRSPEKRTKEECQKVFNSVLSFLKFTTEGEEDFNNKYLPTLDFQTRVDANGLILYKFFEKPMSSNLCIQNGTALAKQTVFSALRQDLCRRLLNTSSMEDDKIFVEVAERYIQRLVNSGHRFSFIKSIMLQGLTRYKYMVERDALPTNDPKYQPLYRSREYKREERMILKRIEKTTWYKGMELGDQYRQDWKKRVRLRGQNINNNVPSGTLRIPGKNNEITTTLYVPASENSVLYEEIMKTEEVVGAEMDWGVKIIEKCGTPLQSLFMKKFPIQDGCPLGNKCVVCDKDSIKCTPKGIVYSAVCTICEQEENENLSNYTYIGESGRSFRMRVKEHMENLQNLRSNSFQVNHWADRHGLETEPPKFRFNLVRQFPDALSRQLMEALMIMKEGGLNLRFEYRINELCRMENTINDKTREEQINKSKLERRAQEERIKSFIDVMNSVCNDKKKNNIECANTLSNSVLLCRKRHTTISSLDSGDIVGIKRRRTMAFSTPRSSEVHRLLMEESPIELETMGERSSSAQSGGDDEHTQRSNTNISNDVDVMVVGPTRVMSNSSFENRLYGASRIVEWNARGSELIKRAVSDPNLAQSLQSNAMFSNCVWHDPNQRARRRSEPGYQDELMLDLSSNPSFQESNNSPQQDLVLDANVGPQQDLVLDANGDEVGQCNNSPQQVMVLNSNVNEGEQGNNSPQPDLVLDTNRRSMEEGEVLSVLSGVKRNLSPDQETLLERIRKKSTTLENSPLLKERKIDWSAHKYLIPGKEKDAGDLTAKDVCDERKERTTALARRRLTSVLNNDLCGSPSIPGQKEKISPPSPGYSSEALCGSPSIPGHNMKERGRDGGVINWDELRDKAAQFEEKSKGGSMNIARKKKKVNDKTKRKMKEKEKDDRSQGKINTFFTPTRKPGEGSC